MNTLWPQPLVVPDPVERLVVDDRLDHVAERVAHDGADLGLVPALGELQHRLAQLLELLGRRADLRVDELAPRRLEQQPAGEHAGRGGAGRLKATIDAFAMTVLSRSKNAAMRGASSTAGTTPRVPAPRSTPLSAAGRRLPSAATTRWRPPGPTSPDALAAAPPLPRRRRVPMLVACWSSKGGAGTTSSPPPWPCSLARGEPPAARSLADLAGDVPAALGLPEPDGPGLAGWLAAGADVPADALGRLEVAAGDGLALLPAATGPLLDASAPRCSPRLLADDRGPVVADCGTDPAGAAPASWPPAPPGRSSSPGRASSRCGGPLAAPLRPSGVVLVTEPGRSLTRADVEDCSARRSSPRWRSTRRSPGRSTPACSPRRLPRRPRPGAGPCRLSRRAERSSTRSTRRLLDRDPAAAADLDHVRRRGAPARTRSSRDGRGRRRRRARSPPGPPASARSSRCSPTPPSPR